MAIADNLVAYYKLDNNVIDSHGSHNGTENGTVIYGTAVINNGFLAGASDYLTVADHVDFDFPGAFSISVWFRTAGASPTILSKDSDPGFGADEWFLDYDVSTNDMRWFSNGAAQLNSTTDDLDNGWHHIVVTRDASNDMVLYVDGISRDTANYSSDLTNTDTIEIGSRLAGTNTNMADVDEVGFWKGHALTQAEVTTLYNGGSGLAYELIPVSPIYKEASRNYPVPMSVRRGYSSYGA